MAEVDGDASSAARRGALGRLRAHLAQDIDTAWSDAVLVLSCAITGLVDAAVYNVFTCFVSMQTGNTVYVGLGVAGQPQSSPFRWAKALTAILAFAAGNLFFGRAGGALGPLRRATVVASWALQAALVFAAAGMIAAGVGGLAPGGGGGEDPSDFHPAILLPLGLLSFGSAGQIVQSRVLRHTEVPSVVLTSTYADLMLDEQLFTAPLAANPKRNRRFLSVVLLLLGAALGGFLTRDGNVESSLWLAGSAKTLVALAWIFWRGKGSIQLE